MSLTKFVIFCNRFVGEAVPAKDFKDLENRMLKRHKEFWSHIQFRDEEGRTIQITREWLEAGMSLEEVIEDWIDNATADELEADILISK